MHFWRDMVDQSMISFLCESLMWGDHTHEDVQQRDRCNSHHTQKGRHEVESGEDPAMRHCITLRRLWVVIGCKGHHWSPVRAIAQSPLS